MAVDLAPEAMLGRYLALASVSWQIGFAAAPALSGFALRASPTATWLVAAAMCALAGTAASLLERRLPAATRRTPVPPAALAATETG
jgi:MFS family permease